VHTRSRAAILAAFVVFAIPATAGAASKTVGAGPPLAKPPAGVPQYSDATQFFRTTTTIHVGDSVKWKFYGFHTVYFPKKGAKNASLIAADPTKKYNDTDPAGNPFWFNGQTRLVLSRQGAFPVAGKSYNGKRLVSSGIALGPPKPYTIKFTKKGSFNYYCTVHYGMKGTVKVVAKGKAIPSAKANKRAARKQYAKVVKQLKKDDGFAGPAGNVVQAGNDTVSSTILRFFPATKSVPVGTTVAFKMSDRTNELHTVSFGPPDYLKSIADGFVQPDPANPNGPPTVFNPIIAFPSDLPPLPAYDGKNHGNGFISTGGLDRDAATPNPGVSQITFKKPGTYNYICLIHPEMKGSIVVG
jgi:plastocyanin